MLDKQSTKEAVMNMAGMRVKVGTVPVDSGQVFVVDPCYVLDGEYGEDSPYGRACAASLTDERAGQFSTAGGPFSDAVCTSTGWGDGVYPVYIEYDRDGRVARLIVEFDYEMDDEDEDDDY
jgi:hypothetical protein